MSRVRRIMCVLGTRPEIIKMAPIIREAKNTENIICTVVHTGQHYSPAMDSDIFNDLGLDLPDYKLSVGSNTHAIQTGKIMATTEAVFEKEHPDIVLVQGDTNTVLGAGLTAVKMGIQVGHVEAGLRSGDRSMPEEINRIVIDHISDYLFAPTNESKDILLGEGIATGSIVVTGNTVVDAVLENVRIADQSSRVLERIESEDYIFVTLHRAENVDFRAPLGRVVRALVSLSNSHTVVWPIHPRTKKQLDKFGFTHELTKARNIIVIEPVGFLDSLTLQKHANVVLTDSGGLQEESCILGTPCITLRENTERPETLAVGANRLVGTNTDTIIDTVAEILSNRGSAKWQNPFGDGTAAKHIVSFLQSRL